MADHQQLQETYRKCSDEQLLRLAAVPASLTDEARDALSQELRQRNLSNKDLVPYGEQQAEITSQRNEAPSRDITPKTIAEKPKSADPMRDGIMLILAGGFAVLKDVYVTQTVFGCGSSFGGLCFGVSQDQKTLVDIVGASMVIWGISKIMRGSSVKG